MSERPDSRTIKMLSSVDLRECIRSEGLGFHVLLGSAAFVGLTLALELLSPGWSSLLAAGYLGAWFAIFVLRYRRRDRIEAAHDREGPPQFRC
jgi:hypothetical protein